MMRPHLLWELSSPLRLRQLQRAAYKRIPAAPREGETDGVAPLLAPELRWVLDTKGPQPLKCLKTGKTRVSEPYRTIEHIRDMNFGALPSFVTSSRDERLLARARLHDCSFAASTSSMTSAMSHVYYALSEHMPLDTSDLSGDFEDLSSKFTCRNRKPISIVLRRRDNIWGLDSYPSSIESRNRVLMDLGKALECKLTMEPDTYTERVLDSKGKTQPSLPEAYAYTKMGRMMVRSQLDCRDHENNWFDLKTRAVLAVRHNVDTYEKHLEYLLEDLHGELNSYEREWYDMARSVLLKYSFQARLGRMTGVFVAYHNTQQIFGLQYVPLAVMDKILFRTTTFAEFAFDSCIKLLERLFAEVTSDMGDECSSIAFTLYAPDKRKGKLKVFAERVLSHEPLSRTDQFTREELIKLISESCSDSVESLSRMDWGTLATRYDEVGSKGCKSYLSHSDDLDVLRQLYEKAEGGHIMLYELNVSCKGVGAVSSSPGADPSDYTLKYSLRRLTDDKASPRALARELWCHRRPETVGEVPAEAPPNNFMYKQHSERVKDMDARRRLGPRGNRRKPAGTFNFLGPKHAQRNKKRR